MIKLERSQILDVLFFLKLIFYRVDQSIYTGEFLRKKNIDFKRLLGEFGVLALAVLRKKNKAAPHLSG
jgi:hypothetical protein